MELDAANGLLFFTGYEHDTGTKVAGCMRDEDGDLVWARTFSNSLRATRFTGEVKIAKEANGLVPTRLNIPARRHALTYSPICRLL